MIIMTVKWQKRTKVHFTMRKLLALVGWVRSGGGSIQRGNEPIYASLSVLYDTKTKLYQYKLSYG